LHAAVEPFHSARLEDDRTPFHGIDGEARVLETTQDVFPLALYRRRVTVDEDERRAGRERLSESHARLHPCRFGSRRYRPEERLLARLRRERCGHERQSRPGT
jgi:hypothetical protein